ncbi:MAG TPA: pseudouridine-5'-phosphate glycosidase [Gemmatimonadales bacterium]|nr:pseudouridine-5'-phosphate glycosidase [Gemmatimonadales bacterium]
MTSPLSNIVLSRSVSEARAAGHPIVALESSVLAQGLPIPSNREAAESMAAAVERGGAVPAITGVARGQAKLGLEPDELERFLHREGVSKVSSRDLGAVMARGGDGATTVAAALTICRAAGVQVFATGGIGGVHRAPPFDESADLMELSRTPAVVVCAGAKAILDRPATLERLETLGVAVIGYRTDEFPGFFTVGTGLPVPHRVNDPEGVASVFRSMASVGHPGSLLVVQPLPENVALEHELLEEVLERALQEAELAEVRGSAMTPVLLAAVQEATGGRALAANLALLSQNAYLAAEIATALAAS